MSSEEKIAIPEKGVIVESDVDSEAAAPYQGEHTLRRTMKNRHIAMIRCVRCPFCSTRPETTWLYSIGGVIGTGLFLGTAGALQNGGPVGLLLGYAAVGSICYAV